MRDPLPAIVAASGQSSRMGIDKPLLNADGRTFLARILSALSSGGANPIFVVVRDPKGAVAEAGLEGGGVPILNPNPTPGPISSLQAGIRALPDSAHGTFFCPVDHPLFQPETVRALTTAFAETGAPLLAPTYLGRRGHPVVFSRMIFPELLEDDLPAGARTVIRRYLGSRLEVPVEDPGILVDIDTPADYRRHFS